jgi:hypothetical protein
MGNAVLAVSRGGTISGSAVGPAAPNPGPSTAHNPGSAPQLGKATVAMEQVPADWMPGHPQTARPGTGTVPVAPGPATYQGAQHPPPQAPPPPQHGPGTMGGAQTALTGQPVPSMHAQQPMQAQAAMPAPRPAGGTIQSASYGAPQAMPRPGGDTSGRGPTHVSAHLPPGMPMPSTPPPNIQVIDAPPISRTVAVWVVGVVGAVCLVVGFMIGFLVGR